MKHLESGFFPGTRARMNFRRFNGIYHKREIGSQGWELGKKFLLFTETYKKGQDLIITAHGLTAGWLGTVSIPAGTTLNILGPHGHPLADPGLVSLTYKEFQPYAKMRNGNVASGHVNREQVYHGGKIKYKNRQFFINHSQSLKNVTGTRHEGGYRNYYLEKYEDDTKNNYVTIRSFIERNMGAYENEEPNFIHRRVDVLSIRDQKLPFRSTLKDVLNELNHYGIHYENIYLSFCRCSWNPLASYRAVYKV